MSWRVIAIWLLALPSGRVDGGRSGSASAGHHEVICRQRHHSRLKRAAGGIGYESQNILSWAQDHAQLPGWTLSALTKLFGLDFRSCYNH